MPMEQGPMCLGVQQATRTSRKGSSARPVDGNYAQVPEGETGETLPGSKAGASLQKDVKCTWESLQSLPGIYWRYTGNGAVWRHKADEAKEAKWVTGSLSSS